MVVKEKYVALGVSDFAQFLGISPTAMPRDCLALIKSGDFRYRRLNQQERDATILKVLKQIEAYDVNRKESGDGQKRWKREWKSVYNTFVASGYDPETLVPTWLCRPQIVRLGGDYALPASPRFKRDYYDILRRFVIRKYLADAKIVHEFGCGSGFNVAAIAALLPEATIHGSDWTQYAARIIKALASRCGLRVTGHQFNLLVPDKAHRLPPHTAVLTIGALEQLHTSFEPFLQYILRQNPTLVVHIEPIVELGNTSTLFDFLAVSFDERRRYLKGYLPRLRVLEARKKIRILKVQHTRMGSLYHDSYSIIVWRPL